MPLQSSLALLLQQVGPLLDPLQMISHDQDVWSIAIDETTTMVLETIHDGKQLHISAPVGQVLEEDRYRVHEALLLHNSLWSDTDGLHFALEGPEGQVLLLFQMSTDQLDATTLTGVLRLLGERAAQWRSILRSPLDLAQFEAFSGDFDLGTALRV